MPMSCAAAAWVSFRWRMVRAIRTTSPALMRCSPASARPRSANTLPVLGSCSRASLFGILHLTSQLFEPLPDECQALHTLAHAYIGISRMERQTMADVKPAYQQKGAKEQKEQKGAKGDGRIYPNQPFMSGDLEPGQCGSRTIA